jgi:hypothetical protein
MKKALIIAGAQGSGKTSRARVEAVGRYIETNYAQISEPFGLDVVMRSDPDTVIVDNMPNHAEAWLMAKQLITSETIRISEKCKEARLVKTPNFIFCTSSDNPLLLDLEDRRFSVVEL